MVAPEPNAPERASGETRSGRRKGGALRLAAAVALLILLVGALALLAQNAGVSESTLASMQGFANGVKRWGLVTQAALLALLIVRWRALVDRGRRRGIVKAEEYERVLQLRWHAALLGLAYLILVPIGPMTLWRLFVGA